MENVIKKILLNYDGWLETFSKQLPLALLDKVFNVISVNDKFNDLFSISKELIAGSSLSYLIEATSDKFNSIQSLLKTGASWSGQITIIMKKGHQNAYGTFIPILDSQSAFGYIFIISSTNNGFDEGEEIQSQLLLLDQIAFKVSHQVRSPIARMQGLIELININAFDESQCKVFLSHLKTCVNDLDQRSRELSQLVSNFQSRI